MILTKKKERRKLMNDLFTKIVTEIFEFRSEPDDIVNPFTMARQFGIVTAEADFSGYPKLKGKLGFHKIEVEDEGVYKHIICYKSDIDPVWKPFILAHELGHFFMYTKGIEELPKVSIIANAFPENNSIDESDLNEKELVCNKFAREMLMPANKFRSLVKHYLALGAYERSTREMIIARLLANDFEVPFNHAYLRAQELGVYA